MMWGHRRSPLACLLVFASAMLACAIPQTASAASGFALSRVATPHALCREPSSSAGATCEALAVPTVASSSAEATGSELEGSGENGGFDPKDLHEAYKLPEKGGSGNTIAIVDAYNDPYAESDLQQYRAKYKVYYKGTETACTETNSCFKKVNQKGEASNYPENESGWSGEISLDLDMVAAACAECKILLVEANEEGITNLGPSDEEAEKLGATVISNSWNNGFEGSAPKEVDAAEEEGYNKYFDHENVPILFAGGDYGYSVRYPAVSRYVIAVGGTKLKKDSEGSRKWSEEVWSNTSFGYRGKGRGTGSGCSKYESKPKWQADKACTHRIQNDVSAVAAPESPVSVYDTYEGGWTNLGGTSASSPFVAGIKGLSSSHTRLLKADAFYLAKGSLLDVTEGSDGTCTPPSEDEYFCTAKVGYDGPTGNGAPDGGLAVGPAVTTEAATSVTKTGATLNGTLNPEGAETKYYFEYGTSETYATKTAEASAGSGTGNVKVSKALTGLTAGTRYYFRIVATNSTGTGDGAGESFSTLPNAPVDTEPPVISPATPDQAVLATTTNGAWTNSPTSYEYQWERCNATGGECLVISGATSATYTPVEADVGHTLVAKITAKNSGGSNSAHSKATNKVKSLGEITTFGPLPKESYPADITAGPDGNLWFTEEGAGKIAKITTSGTMTEYSLPAGSKPWGITPAPAKENVLWFTEGGTDKIGKITTSGTITEYSRSGGGYLSQIATGPDGHLWFTVGESASKIGKITTAGAITEYSLPENSGLDGIAAGPDGNMWFTESGKIGKISTSGTVTEYSLPVWSFASSIAAGPDGELWFTAEGEGGVAKIGKITTSGGITEYSLPANSDPRNIAAGADGNLWFTDFGTKKIGRITTSGTVTEYALTVSPWDITAGPDDNLWFTGTGTVGRIIP